MSPEGEPGWLQPSQSGVRIAVRVTPRSSSNCVVIDDRPTLGVRVTAAPDDGKANRAVIRLLAARLGVARSRLRIVRGQKSREKLVEIEGIGVREASDALAA